MSAPEEQLHPGPEITVWAPLAHRVEIEWASPEADGATEVMEPKGDGWWLWQAPALVWLALLALFGLSFASAYLPLGSVNIALNLLLAGTMIVLVVTFLMDLKSATALIRVVATASLLWLILMFALTFSDYAWRYY